MITVKSVEFKYGNSKRKILSNISVKINKGDYISIVGENGCGKSTLIKLMLGLLKPVSGTIIVEAKRIGYVPQKKNNLTGFPITVFELLDSYRKILRIKDKNCIERVLDEVNLSAFKNMLAGELSGGQLQKLYIARALIGADELILLDEPSTGIDFKSQKEIYSFIKKLNTEKKLTVVSVDHNIDAALLNSTLIFHISDGTGHLCNPKKYADEFLHYRNTDLQNLNSFKFILPKDQ